MADGTEAVHSDLEAQMFNDDIEAILYHIDRGIVEMRDCQSANLLDLMPFDKDRLKDILQKLKAMLDFAASHRLMDFPETAARLRDIPPMPDFPIPENMLILRILRYLERVRGELRECQSARMANSLIDPDKKRADIWLTTIDEFIGVVESVTPIDMPESSPQQPMTEIEDPSP